MPWDNLNLGGESCCACPTRVCVRLKCKTIVQGGYIEGATVTIREAAVEPHTGAILGTGMTNRTGGFCAIIENEGSVDIQVEKAGYHPVELTDEPVPCATGRTFALATCQTTTKYIYYVWGCPIGDPSEMVIPGVGYCPVPGALVEFSGPAAGSGTSDASGRVEVDLDVPADCDLSALMVTITPPGGSGFASVGPALALGHLLPCQTTTNWPHKLEPASPCVCGPCNTPLPPTLEYSDDYGSCTLTLGWHAGSGLYGWIGSYTYQSNKSVVVTNECAPYSGPWCMYPRGSEITVDVRVSFVHDSCAGGHAVVERWAPIGAGLTACPPGGVLVPAVTANPNCQTAIAPTVGGAWAWRISRGTANLSCGAQPLNIVVPFGYQDRNILARITMQDLGPVQGDVAGTATITGEACGS